MDFNSDFSTFYRVEIARGWLNLIEHREQCGDNNLAISTDWKIMLEQGEKG